MPHAEALLCSRLSGCAITASTMVLTDMNTVPAPVRSVEDVDVTRQDRARRARARDMRPRRNGFESPPVILNGSARRVMPCFIANPLLAS